MNAQIRSGHVIFLNVARFVVDCFGAVAGVWGLIILGSASFHQWSILGVWLPVGTVLFISSLVLLVLSVLSTGRIILDYENPRLSVSEILQMLSRFVLPLCAYLFLSGSLVATITPESEDKIIILNDGRVLVYPESIQTVTSRGSAIVLGRLVDLGSTRHQVSEAGVTIEIKFSAKVEMFDLLMTEPHSYRKSDISDSIDWQAIMDAVLNHRDDISIQSASEVPLLFLQPHIKQVAEDNWWLRDLSVSSVKVVSVSADEFQ